MAYHKTPPGNRGLFVASRDVRIQLTRGFGSLHTHTPPQSCGRGSGWDNTRGEFPLFNLPRIPKRASGGGKNPHPVFSSSGRMTSLSGLPQKKTPKKSSPPHPKIGRIQDQDTGTAHSHEIPPPQSVSSATSRPRGACALSPCEGGENMAEAE